MPKFIVDDSVHKGMRIFHFRGFLSWCLLAFAAK